MVDSSPVRAQRAKQPLFPPAHARPILDSGPRSSLSPSRRWRIIRACPAGWPPDGTQTFPFAPDAWIDPAATRIGYEVSFTKYFYKPAPLRPLAAIAADLRALEAETAGLLDRILEDRRP